MLLKHSQSVTERLTKAETLAQTAFQYAVILGVILALAYILSATSALMLEVLEGKHLGFLRGAFYRTQWGRLSNLDAAYKEVWLDQREILEMRSGSESELYASRQIGDKSGKPMTSKLWAKLWFSKSFGSRFNLAELRFRYRRGLRVRPDLLVAVVSAVAHWLTQYAAEKAKGKTLDRAHHDVLEAIQYVIDWAQFERIRLLNERQFCFPGNRPSAADGEEGPSTNSILAPTRMGNIGRTIRSYALIRYQLDLDIFWTRLQSAIQKDTGDFLKNLQDTRAQLDCMVTLVWLTSIFTLCWTLALLRVYPTSTDLEFRILGIGGAVLTMTWYGMACQSYRVFADLMRSSVDLFRFKMLDLLHLALPYGSEEERELWRRLGNTIGYADLEQFTYKN